MRARQKLPVNSAFPSLLTVFDVDETGRSTLKVVDQSEVKLPDCETTNLALLMKAGVDIKRVDSRIVAGKSVVTDLSVPGESEKIDTEEEGE